MRRAASDVAKDLTDFARAALAEKLGPVSAPDGADHRSDAVVEVDGRELEVSFKTTTYATTGRIQQMKRDDVDSGGGAVLVVADRVNSPARKAIEDMGWGHLETSTGKLFLRAPGIRIDTTVSPLEAGPASSPTGVVGRAGQVLAYEILRRHYDGNPKAILTSTSKEEFDLARSSTSDAMRALVAADLVTAKGAPALPVLFWELAKVWAPADRRWLASVPDPKDWASPPDSKGQTWHLGGAEAAIVHGAPAVGAGKGPVDLYVPGPVVLSTATRRYGAADPISAVASVAVPSAHQVISPRHTSTRRHHRGWPVVHPVAAALDLAAHGDARSQQILDEWHPDGQAVWHDH